MRLLTSTLKCVCCESAAGAHWRGNAASTGVAAWAPARAPPQWTVASAMASVAAGAGARPLYAAAVAQWSCRRRSRGPRSRRRARGLRASRRWRSRAISTRGSTSSTSPRLQVREVHLPQVAYIKRCCVSRTSLQPRVWAACVSGTRGERCAPLCFWLSVGVRVAIVTTRTHSLSALI